MRLFFALLPFILISLVGCSTSQDIERKRERERSSKHHLGVSLEADAEENLPQVDQQQTGSFIGPTPTINEENFSESQEVSSTRLPIIAVSFSAGLARAMAHVKIVREFEKLQIKPSIVTGSGSGAIIATLVGFELNADLIEWRLFNFLSATAGVKLFSDEWHEHLDNILLDELKDRRIEQAKLTLLLPVYDKTTKKPVLLSRGSLREIIRAQFILNPNSQSSRYSASYTMEAFNAEKLEAAGADFVIGVDALGDNIRFLKTDSFLLGIYGRAVSAINREKDALKYYFKLPVDSVPIDANSQLELRNVRISKELNDKIIELQEKIKSW